MNFNDILTLPSSNKITTHGMIYEGVEKLGGLFGFASWRGKDTGDGVGIGLSPARVIIICIGV